MISKFLSSDRNKYTGARCGALCSPCLFAERYPAAKTGQLGSRLDTVIAAEEATEAVAARTREREIKCIFVQWVRNDADADAEEAVVVAEDGRC